MTDTPFEADLQRAFEECYGCQPDSMPGSFLAFRLGAQYMQNRRESPKPDPGVQPDVPAAMVAYLRQMEAYWTAQWRQDHAALGPADHSTIACERRATAFARCRHQVEDLMALVEVKA